MIFIDIWQAYGTELVAAFVTFTISFLLYGNRRLHASGDYLEARATAAHINNAHESTQIRMENYLLTRLERVEKLFEEERKQNRDIQNQMMEVAKESAEQKTRIGKLIMSVELADRNLIEQQREHEMEIERLTKRVDELTTQVDALRQALDERDSRILQLTRQRDEALSRITELSKQLNDLQEDTDEKLTA